MITVSEAWDFYQENIRPLSSHRVSLKDALGRVLAEDVRSKTPLPPFPQSAMDGYALIAEETSAATPEAPTRHKLMGEVPAGQLKQIPKIGPGEAVRIFTGGYVPDGADVVLMQEDAEVSEDFLLVRNPLNAGRHCRKLGEEIGLNETIVTAGTRVTPGVLSAISVSGVDSVSIVQEPVISILTTGDEVIEPGNDLAPGEVYDADSIMTSSWLKALGYSKVTSTALLDSLEDTVDALRSAFESSDLVLTCGGVSVGDRDYVIKAAEQLGFEQIFWRVKQRPGKPLYFGLNGKKILMGIPGNPGSVYVSLQVHIRRVLELLEGIGQPEPRISFGKLSEPEGKSPHRDFFMRCTTRLSDDGEMWLDPLPRQSSHMISNLTQCTALAWIPAGDGNVERGQIVEWISCLANSS
jgi:molybdopterin molybdotransferase